MKYFSGLTKIPFPAALLNAVKKIILSGIILLYFVTAIAQQSKQKSKIELSFGASVPFSTFASGKPGTHIRGFANIGQALTISYFHPTENKLGFMAMLLGQRNPLNTSTLEEKFSSTPFNTGFSTVPWPPTGPPPPPTYYDNWSFSSEAWYTTSLLAGAYMNIPLEEKTNLFFNIKAAIGGAYASSPEYKGYTQSDTATVAVFQKKNHAFGFSYTVSPGLTYLINPATNLSFNIHYFGTASMKFKKMETGGTMMETTPGPFGPTTAHSGWQTTGDVQQSLQAINISLGIQFAL